jgi:hypothetical protein
MEWALTLMWKCWSIRSSSLFFNLTFCPPATKELESLRLKNLTWSRNDTSIHKHRHGTGRLTVGEPHGHHNSDNMNRHNACCGARTAGLLPRLTKYCEPLPTFVNLSNT